ncbi:hypothetical protein HIM_01831 [Hirsutella minnesotensis 3608]|nr:hypothetical protein HIM_01831 [Hirsutella minnesotensis 3608]
MATTTTITAMTGSPQGLTLTPLHPTFGAECEGVDFSCPVPEETIQAIRQAMAKYGVLVFRGTQLDDAGHEAFARQFGEPDNSAVQLELKYSWISWIFNRNAEYRLAPHMELTDASNLDRDGHVLPVNSIRAQANQGNSLFHVDCSYNSRRAGFSILRAHQLPPAGTGGDTAFADTRTAYEDLDDARKAEIHDLVLSHSIFHSRAIAAPQSIFGWVNPNWLSSARHRLVQLHEPSGRTNLYIAAHAFHVDGKPAQEGMSLIQDLLRHASQDKYTFKVAWENKGDMIIWDNTCVMHRACGGSFQGKYVRDLRRATVYDSSSSAWGLNKSESHI